MEGTFLWLNMKINRHCICMNDPRITTQLNNSWFRKLYPTYELSEWPINSKFYHKCRYFTTKWR